EPPRRTARQRGRRGPHQLAHADGAPALAGVRPELSGRPPLHGRAVPGVCTGGRCTAGQINDLCTVNSDCNLAANTCRVIVNWADIADLTLDYAKVGRTDVTPLFTPATPGCSRKIDLPLDPARAANRLRVKAEG